MNDQTPESRCDALAKRIAELDPAWPKPGMACRDHITQYVFRYVLLAGWHTELPWRKGYTAHVPSAKDRAVGNGPDWRDDPTLGAILLSMRWHELVFDGDSWQCWDTETMPSRRNTLAGATRAEAILTARLAQLGGPNAR